MWHTSDGDLECELVPGPIFSATGFVLIIIALFQGYWTILGPINPYIQPHTHKHNSADPETCVSIVSNAMLPLTKNIFGTRSINWCYELIIFSWSNCTGPPGRRCLPHYWSKPQLVQLSEPPTSTITISTENLNTTVYFALNKTTAGPTICERFWRTSASEQLIMLYIDSHSRTPTENALKWVRCKSDCYLFARLRCVPKPHKLYTNDSGSMVCVWRGAPECGMRSIYTF